SRCWSAPTRSSSRLARPTWPAPPTRKRVPAEVMTLPLDTSVKPGFLRLWWWNHRMRRIEKGMSPSEVMVALGVPTTQLAPQAEMKFWSYDLGRFGNTRHSIRVAFAKDKVNQIYMGMDRCR